MFSLTWDVIFKLFITLLVILLPASVQSSVREYQYRRQLDAMHERLETLQHHVVVIITSLHVPLITYGHYPVLAIEYYGRADSCT